MISKKEELMCSSFFILSEVLQTFYLKTQFIYLIIFAGFPAAIALSGTSFVTTLPAPTTAFSPIVTPGKITLFEPIQA